jgi:hypothetical protein
MAPFALLSVFLLAAVGASGQSLAEIARKERERRARSQGAAVITEKELGEARGDRVSVSGKPSEETPPEAPEEPGDVEGETGRRRLTAKEVRDLRQEWARIWEDRMRQAEAELERARDDLYQCRSAERYFFVPLAIDCEGVDLRLASAEAQLKEVRASRYNWEILLPDDSKP